jgi:glycosyltransferase involved in cell wall biosynthesis
MDSTNSDLGARMANETSRNLRTLLTSFLSGGNDLLSPSSADPLVTVLLPTYNRATCLDGAIQSVINQTYPEWELIIIDDGSTDETQNVLQKYLSHPRIQIVKTENRGQAAALNYGLAIAHGEYVAFLDSDDEYLPNHLQVLVDCCRGHDGVLGKFELSLNPNEPVPVVRDFYRPNTTIPVTEIECITGVLFGKRRLFMDIGGFRHVKSTDTDMYTRLKSQGYDWVYANIPTYHYFFGRFPNSVAIQERN